MNHFIWQCHCAAAEGRPLRPSYEAVNDGGEQRNEANAADRLVFTRLRVGATEPVFIVSEMARSHGTRHRASSPSLHGDRLRVRKTTEPSDSLWHQNANQASRSPSPSISKLLAPAQQYLQALREDISPPRELSEAWEGFYRICDPLVRRTVAACSLYRADDEDCVQEAWAEIATKLTRFEYDAGRGTFESWLRIVVHRAACHYTRRDLRQTSGSIDQDLSAVECPRLLGPATTSQREELRASVRQTLDAFRTTISSTAFRILVMTTIHGQTSTEIGKLLGLSPGHVRVSRHRTVKKFREFIAEQPGLSDAFGISTLPQNSAETSAIQRTGELRKYSENSSSSL